MDEKTREARRAYMREWAKKNPDKVREYQERFYKKQVAKMAAVADEKPSDGGNETREV